MIPVNRRAFALLAMLLVGVWTAGCAPVSAPSDSPETSTSAFALATASPAPDASSSSEPTSEPSPSDDLSGLTLEPTANPTANRTAEPNQTAKPNPTARPNPTAKPNPTAEPTPTPSATPTPAPTPRPSLVIEVNGIDMGAWMLRFATGDHVDVDVSLVTVGVQLSSCKLTQAIVPDKPGIAPTSVDLTPKPKQSVALIDGLHTFTATCPSSRGPLTSRTEVRAADGRPERCLGFDFQPSAITVSTLAELRDGIVKTWQGCVTTPWVPVYWVTITFRADGTYSAVSTEVLDGQQMIAMYYGIDDDSPNKKYQLNDLQDNQQGIGDIDIVFGPGSPTRDDLRHITLMGDKLSFEFFHFGIYGPVTFRLNRS
jgi:hypothetical protein